MKVTCRACGNQTQFFPAQYRCECGYPWEPDGLLPFDPDLIGKKNISLSRYAPIFGRSDFDWSVSLGAGSTPIARINWERNEVYFKLEYVSPTGSFKDRGTEVEMAFLKAAGVTHVVEDSSGNAGAAMAAYAAKAGLHADIYAPASAPQAKLDQIAVYGAELHRIPGPRAEATRAVLAAVAQGAVYASHAYNPAYLLGQCTFAWELWEQMDGVLPDAVVIPVGQGGLFLGAYLGFRHLLQSGIIAHLPKLFAVQPQVFAPLDMPFSQDLQDVPPYQPSASSIADGVAIVKPARADRILQGLRESGGGVISCSEQKIRHAYFSLAEKGMFVEPTSALAAAAIAQISGTLKPGASIMVALTGSGMKTPLLVK